MYQQSEYQQSEHQQQSRTGVDLEAENTKFVGTGGVSQTNAGYNFIPAFLDHESGEVEISKFRNGMPAPFHSLDGLPESWIAEKDASGQVVRVRDSVISGFVRLGRFFTREQAAEFVTECV